MSRDSDVCLIVGRVHTLRLLFGSVLLAFDQSCWLNHYPETLGNSKKVGKRKLFCAPCSANAVVKRGAQSSRTTKSTC